MRSMTGFGQAVWQAKGRRIVVEIRSVNQRFLDVRLNLPREYQSWESELRQLVMASVERGKVDINVSRSGTASGEINVEVNEALARATLTAWRDLQRRLKVPGEIDVTLLLNRPELVRVAETRPDASVDIGQVRRLLTAALRRFNAARVQEGKALRADMVKRARHLRQIEAALRRRTTALAPELTRRLGDRMAALLGEAGVDSTRLLQEAAILAERADVTEELVRLASHLDRLEALLAQRAAVGKAIDFLLQEIHREINTIASKSADIEVTNLTLEARAEVEKLREQTQNVE
jgi:uncharacterized protein (TIGR00255 family)